MPLLRSRRCDGCECEYDVLEFPQQGITLTIDAPEDRDGCPKCEEAAYTPIVKAGTGVELGDEAGVGKIYPYYDRGLGCHVSSAAHRRQLCRARGLVPVDGDFDSDRILSEQWAEDDHYEKVYEDYADRLDNSPEFADARKLRDRGHPDFQWEEL